MLRRRILASAMASVMAIGSVAVVASAEDAAVATAQVKTKADLEAYVKSFDKFREDGIYDYGSISGENFLDAIEYADNVLDDDKATVDDYTAAYSMIEAVYNKLTIYSAEELAALIKNCQKDYDSANILNEELGDAIYDADKFATFESAFENAENVLDSSDSRIITDAYETLDAAKKDLTALDVVTKSAFRSALKDYETALQKEFAYDAWRIGTVESSHWGYAQTVAYGTLYEHVASIEDKVNKAYEELDEIKALSKTTQPNIVEAYKAAKEGAEILNGFKADDTNRATKANVKALLNEYHGRLVHDYNTTVANELYKAVVNALDAGKVEVTVADGEYSTQTLTVKEINDKNAAAAAYNAAHAADENFVPKSMIDFWYVDSAEYKVDPNGGRYTAIIADDENAATNSDIGKKLTVRKLISAEISVKSTETAFYIEVDDNGYAKYTINEDGDYIFNIQTSKDKFSSDAKTKLVSKKSWIDLTSLVDIGDINDSVSAVDNHYINNVVDGDYFEYIPYIDRTQLASFGVATASKNWVVDQFATALNAAGLLEDDFDDDKNEGTISDEFLTTLETQIAPLYDADMEDGKYNGDDEIYNKLQELGGAYAHWTVKDEFIPYYFGTIDKLGSLANQIGQWCSPNHCVIGTIADQDMDGITSNGEKTYTELDTAIETALFYVNSDNATLKGNTMIEKLDTIDAIKKDSASGSSTEWALVYRYLKYALSDKYDATYGTNTKKDVQELIEKAYDLAELTGDAALFSYHHNALVDARQDALDWIKAVNKIKDYKDNKTSYKEMVSTDVYKMLKDAYDALEKDYNAFKYSFEDVYYAIADTKAAIDDGELKATDTLVAALEDTAYRLSIVESLDGLDDNDAFTADREFQGFNRVYTHTDTSNGYTLQVGLADSDKIGLPKAKDGAAATSHWNLMTAYEALLAEVKAQKEPAVLVGDMNKDNVVDQRDAAVILKMVVDGETIDIAIGDFDGDGYADQRDASAILKHVVNQA